MARPNAEDGRFGSVIQPSLRTDRGPPDLGRTGAQWSMVDTVCHGTDQA